MSTASLPERTSISFLSLPLELRHFVYGYVLADPPPKPSATHIELPDERVFIGAPLDICLRLHWYWFCANRQIVQEGVEYGFRWTKVRFAGGPWVIQSVLSKIGQYLSETDSEDRKWIKRIKGLHYERSPSYRQYSDDKKLLFIPGSPILPPPQPLTHLIRDLELCWTSKPYDLKAPGVLPRISTFELRPLFLRLSSLPNLHNLTVALRWRDAPFANGQRNLNEAYNTELTSYGLALLLTSAKPSKTSATSSDSADHSLPYTSGALRTLTVRHMPIAAYTALNPPDYLRGFSDPQPGTLSVFSLLRDQTIPDLCTAFQGVHDWNFRANELNLDARVIWQNWDPLIDTDMLGAEAHIIFSVKPGHEGVGVPEKGLSVCERKKTWSPHLPAYQKGLNPNADWSTSEQHPQFDGYTNRSLNHALHNENDVQDRNYDIPDEVWRQEMEEWESLRDPDVYRQWLCETYMKETWPPGWHINPDDGDFDYMSMESERYEPIGVLGDEDQEPGTHNYFLGAPSGETEDIE